MMTYVSNTDAKRYKIYQNNTLVKSSDVAALLCPSCGGFLRDPIQITACGDRFCRSCIDNIMSKSERPYKCPVDNEEFEPHQVRRDRGCLKELQSLEIECTTQPTPCNWRGRLTELESHLEVCPNAQVECSLGCGKHIVKSQLTSHLSSQCSNRPTQCQHCNTSVPIHSLQNHYQVCDQVPIDCTYCKKHLTNRKQLEDHLESECSEYEIRCPMHSTTNCIFEAKRPQMSDHMQQHNIKLAELLVTAVEKIEILETKLDKLTNSQQNSEEKIVQLTKKVEKLENEKKEKDKTIIQLEKQVKEAPQFSLSRGNLVERDCVVTSQTRSASFKSLNPAASSKRYSGFDTEAAVVSVMRQEMDSHQTQLLKINENLQTVQQSLTQHAVVIDEVRLRQDVLDVKTTNGIFIWKIPDIRRRYRDALDGRTISLYSPPFYTSPHGYRMCVRTYLNGDGIGKGTHMSMFFVLMRSEHDSLLSYPFKQSVRFTLINQANPTASITEAFVPDLSSPSFQRPQKDMNVASGFPKFAAQSVLHEDDFTQGNVIYIKCQVDLSGLSLH